MLPMIMTMIAAGRSNEADAWPAVAMPAMEAGSDSTPAPTMDLTRDVTRLGIEAEPLVDEPLMLVLSLSDPSEKRAVKVGTGG